MPIEYTVHDQGALVYAQATGTLNDDDLVAHTRRLVEDPRVAQGFYQLLDCRWVDDQLTDQVIERLAEVHAQGRAKLAGARYAIVAHNPLWFRAGAQYRCGSEQMSVIVFNDPSTACIWLGLDYRELVAKKGPASRTLNLDLDLKMKMAYDF